jgi:predicted RNA-binding Zn ribbon-like protein
MVVLPMPLATLVGFVNGWGTEPREAAGEQDQPFPPLRGLIRGAGKYRDADLRRYADLLYPVFSTADVGERAKRLTELLAQTGVRPAAQATAGRITAGWLVDDERHVLLAAAAIALHAQLAATEPDRLGTCGATRCADVYIDASPAGHRRFCSISCQNRTRVAAFRRRNANSA